MWDLSSLTRDQSRIPCIVRWILYHWMTREVPPAHSFFLSFFFLIYLFIFGCVGSSFLCEGSLQLRQAGPLFIAVRGPLTIAASLAAEHKLQTQIGRAHV